MKPRRMALLYSAPKKIPGRWQINFTWLIQPNVAAEFRLSQCNEPAKVSGTMNYFCFVLYLKIFLLRTTTPIFYPHMPFFLYFKAICIYFLLFTSIFPSPVLFLSFLSNFPFFLLPLFITLPLPKWHQPMFRPGGGGGVVFSNMYSPALCKNSISLRRATS